MFISTNSHNRIYITYSMLLSTHIQIETTFDIHNRFNVVSCTFICTHCFFFRSLANSFGQKEHTRENATEGQVDEALARKDSWRQSNLETAARK